MRRRPSRALTRSTSRSSSARLVVRAETGLLLRARLGDQHREAGEIETETGIERIGERGEPLDEQRADVLRVAQRARGGGGHAPHRAVGAEQRELDLARAVAAALERQLQARGELLHHGEHVLFARDRLGKTLLGQIGRHRPQRRERLALAAERAVELAQQIGAEAGGERRARQIQNVADALEADAGQRARRCRRRAAAPPVGKGASSAGSRRRRSHRMTEGP